MKDLTEVELDRIRTWIEKANKWDETQKLYAKKEMEIRQKNEDIVVRLNERIILLDKICQQDFSQGIIQQDLEDEIKELKEIRDGPKPYEQIQNEKANDDRF